MTDILVIPDPHAHPEYDNDRFDWLGKYVLDRRPDVVVCIGDWADLPSLSTFDKGKKGFEGRRYKKDIEAAINAQERFLAPLNDYNAIRRERKEKQWSPRLVMCMGNHENRINRAVDCSPELDGWVSTENLEYEEHGWEVYPFQETATVEGITFCHYFASGVMNRPISGENIGKSLINKRHVSSVQGHSHVYDHSERTNGYDTKIFGMSVGCFTHPDMIEGWNKGSHQMWWRGVVEINECDGEGYYDELRQVTMRKLRRMYS